MKCRKNFVKIAEVKRSIAYDMIRWQAFVCFV